MSETPSPLLPFDELAHQLPVKLVDFSTIIREWYQPRFHNVQKVALYPVRIGRNPSTAAVLLSVGAADTLHLLDDQEQILLVASAAEVTKALVEHLVEVNQICQITHFQIRYGILISPATYTAAQARWAAAQAAATKG